MGFRREMQALLMASVCAAVGFTFGRYLISGWMDGQTSIQIAPHGAVSFLCLAASLMFLDIWSMSPADSHTLATLFSQYKYLVYIRLRLPYLKWFIWRTTMDPKKVNEESLLHILRTNEASSYGKEYNFAEMNSREDFVRMHPITTHEHYQGYINRIMAGEENVLYPAGETRSMITTSGTTGEAKVYAFVKEHIKYCHFQFSQLFPTAILKLMNLQRMAQFHIFSSFSKTTGGLPMGAASQIIFLFPPHNLIPTAYSKLHTEDASYYAQAVFSLAERELRYISSFSADLMYSYFKFMTENWGHLCDDISNGHIGDHISMPDDVRAELSKHLQADPSRASELREAMKIGIVGLAKRVWLDMEFIIMSKSAAFKMCANILMENHFCGIKVIGFVHGATEGITGLNLEAAPEMGEVFTLVPYPAFIEFIPLESVEEKSPSTMFPEQLELNHMYEVVHTSYNGLYRCRYGDIIKVVGFRNKTPKYEFVFKLGQRLNIAYEKTPDSMLYSIIKQCEGYMSPGVKLVNYTTTESIALEKIAGSLGKGHYVFFMEFATNREISCKRLADEMDQALYTLYQPYKRFKDCESIGPLRVIQVKCGTFEGLKAYIWNNKPHGQFKMPRVLRKEPALKYLLDQTVQN